jgi:Undecaprenyl-phosphate glucose phosphotransferase
MEHHRNLNSSITPQNLDQLIDGESSPASEFYKKTWMERLKERAEGRRSFAILAASLMIADILLIALAGLTIYAVYVYQPGGSIHQHYVYATALVAVVVPLVLREAGGYGAGLMQSVSRQMMSTASVLSGVFLVAMAGLFLTKLGEEFSRIWLVSTMIATFVLISTSHWLMRSAMRRWHHQGKLSTRVVIVGGGEPAEHLLKALEENNSNFVEVVGLFDDRDDQRSPASVGRLPKLGSVQDLIDFARNFDVDMLVITLPLSAENRLLQIMKRLWVLPVDIRLSAHAQRLRYRPRAYSWLGNVPLIDVFDRPLRDWGQLLKLLEDKIIATLALVLAAPVMLAVAIAIKLESKGPVLFKQVRYGFNNQPIKVLKFRSMYTDMCDEKANRLVTRDDPRVTRVGKFIRKTSLDELPQLINVLRGELSLVGPRPHAHHAKAADRLYDEVVDGYFARHKVKPGITGWAQINGWRGETDTEEKIQRRVEFDLYYIENWSLLFDLQILFMTPFALMKTDNAY